MFLKYLGLHLHLVCNLSLFVLKHKYYVVWKQYDLAQIGGCAQSNTSQIQIPIIMKLHSEQ